MPTKLKSLPHSKSGRTAQTGASIEQKLFLYLRENFLPRTGRQELPYDQNLFESGIVDSAGLISFIAYMEQEFAVKIPDEDLLPENFLSITRIAGYIRSHQQPGNEHPQKMRRMGP